MRLTRLRADAGQVAIATVAAGSRAFYSASLLALSVATWYATWRGPDMRMAALVNLVAAVIMLTGTMVRRYDLVWAACLTALLSHGLPGSRVGEMPSQLLPWTTAATALLMVESANRHSRGLVVATWPLLAGFGIWLAITVRWAAIDYFITALLLVIGYSVARTASAFQSNQGTVMGSEGLADDRG